MKRFVLLTLLVSIILISIQCPAPASHKFKLAQPGYVFSFQEDHANHELFKTEWWYYTGHLRAEDESIYGYQLTFFRTALDLKDSVQNSPWQVNDLYMAHFCISDINHQSFVAKHRIRRSGLGSAGSENKQFKVWNQNWSAEKKGSTYTLKAKDQDYSIDLELSELKPPVIQGIDGISRKASAPGCASHYYSITRLDTKGTISVGGKKLKVSGQSWMDHEFGSNQLTPDQVGWDWFSIQLDDNRELMFYLMRLKTGGYDPVSSGTIIDCKGNSKHLSLKDFSITQTGSWQSKKTQAIYPSCWKVLVYSEKIELFIKPKMKNQELEKGDGNPVSYWEGACAVSGTDKNKPIKGQSYVELTGYAEQFKERI